MPVLVLSCWQPPVKPAAKEGLTGSWLLWTHTREPLRKVTDCFPTPDREEMPHSAVPPLLAQDTSQLIPVPLAYLIPCFTWAFLRVTAPFPSTGNQQELLCQSPEGRQWSAMWAVHALLSWGIAPKPKKRTAELQILGLLLIYHRTVGSQLNFPSPQFSHLENGESNNT